MSASAKRDMNRPVWLRLQGILVYPPILHDNFEVLGGIGDQVDILQWIAVDQQQIGKRALFHDAELARIRTAFAPDNASNSALVPVAMASASAGLYQRTSEARIAPCCCASTCENRNIGAPRRLDLVLLRQFVCRGYAPGQTSSALAHELSPPESLVSTPRGGAADLTTRPSRQSAWRLSRPSGSHVRYTSHQQQWPAE